MQGAETAQGEANLLQTLLDQLSYALSPASWLTDMQCLKLGWTPQDTIVKQLQLALGIIPVTSIIFGLVVGVTHCCKSICCRRGATGANALRRASAKHKVLLTMAIVAWLLLPEVIMTLLSPTACFRSIASEQVENLENSPEPPAPDKPILRMSILPDEYCGGDFHNSLFMLIWPGLFIYAILLPLICLRQAASKSHIIYRTGVSS